MTANIEYFDDLSNAVPNGWTERWQTHALNTSTITWFETTVVGSGYLRAQKITTDLRNLITWDELNTTSDIEVLFKTRASAKVSGGFAGGVILRASGAAAAETGYRIALDGTGTGNLGAAKYSGGTPSALTLGTPSAALNWAVDTYYWVRVQISGTTTTIIRARAWIDGSNEPGTWMVDTSDTSSPITAAGWVGCFAFSANGATGNNVDFESFSYNTAGTAALPTVVGTQLFDAASGATPANWAPTSGWTQTNVTWLENASGFLQAIKTTSSGRRNLLYARTGTQDCEVMVKVRSTISPSNTANAVGPAVMVRAGGTAGFEQGFVARLLNDASGNPNTAQLIRYDGTGGQVVLYANAASTWVANTWYRMRLRAFGTTISFKWWLDGSAEPGSWTFTGTDASATAPGCGLFIFDTQTTTDWDWFTWATNGATAPDPSVSATATQSILIGQTAAMTNSSPVVTDNATAAQHITFGQTATSLQGNLNVIGGIAIGTAGVGTVYTGLKLIYGDDFLVKPNMWNFRNPTGRYAPLVISGGQRRYNPFEMMNFVDASYRGPRHESPTDFGAVSDPFSVASSILTITTSVRPGALDNHVSYNSVTGAIDQEDIESRPRNISGGLHTCPAFMLAGDGDWVIEAFLQMPTGLIPGYADGFWTSGFRWPDWGEFDIIETWKDTQREENTTLHISDTDGGPAAHNSIVGLASPIGAVRLVPTSRFVQIVARKRGNSFELWDDFTTAGTLALVASYTDTARVGRFRGPHDVRFDLNVYTRAFGTYDPSKYPATLKFDWFRIWAPTAAEDPQPLIELTPVNTTPGGSWASSFPAATSLYGAGYTPYIEDIISFADNEDGPGLLGRQPFLLNGLTIDKVGRTTSGTVPLTEGGTVGIYFQASLAIGGPCRLAFKRFNVAPAEQAGKVFPSFSPVLGQAFTRTIAFTDFHSGNLGPHDYTVSFTSGGTGLTIGSNTTQNVTISGTPINETTVVQIICRNQIGQTTTITRTITPSAFSFRYDFRNNENFHNGTAYASFAAAITAGVVTFTQTMASGIYAEDFDYRLTQVTAANQPRISNKGLAYEGAVTNLVEWSSAAEGRTMSNVTVAADVINGPSGTKFGDRVQETSASSSHGILSSATNSMTVGDVHSGAAYVKQGQSRYVQIALASAAYPSAYLNIDMDRQNITAQSGFSYAAIKGNPYLSKGWWKVEFTATATATSAASGSVNIFLIDDGSRGRAFPYQGDTNNQIHLWGCHLSKLPKPPIYVSNGTAAPITKPADALTVTIPSGCNAIRFVFEDGSQQTVTGLSAGSYAVPTTLNRTFIIEMIGLPTGSAVNATAGQHITFGQSFTAVNAGGAISAAAIGQDLTFGQSASVKTIVSATTIRGEASTLHAQAVVEMFEYSDVNIGGAQTLRWHAGTTILSAPITWQGKIYLPLPVDVTGFSMSASGALPRPSLKASNIGGQLGGYLRSLDGAVGAKITRKRTLARYLDAVNFPLGNPHADASAFFPDEIYYLARKTNENPIWIEYELAASFDVAGVQIPRRQVIASTCEWVYRSAECGYAGAPVQDIDGNPTTNPALDNCRKTLDACKARFGTNGVLNTSAFPGSLLVQS